MLPRTLITIAVLVSTFVCHGGGPGTADAQEAVDAEYVVYASLLRKMGYDEEKGQLVIQDTTEVGDLLRKPIDHKTLERPLGPSLTKDTTEDFVTKNQTPRTLTNQFGLKTTLILITRADYNQIFRALPLDEAWKLFRSKYPKASSIRTFSRVGFNKDKTQALVHYSYVCGELCGQGQYILLIKKEATWTIEKEWMTWIS